MLKFENITLQIDSEAAQAFRSATSDIKQKIQILFSTWIKEVSLKETTPLLQFMDEISDKAQAEGLTPGILETILNEK